MSTFDSTGLYMDRYDDILTDLIADLQAAFGDNIKTSADSVNGQLARIYSNPVAELNETLDLIAEQFNPQNASGKALSDLVLLNGLTRNEAAFSTVTLSCTANTAGSTIPAGTIVSDGSVDNQFATDIQLILAPSASGNVSATAVVEGAVSAAAGTLTTIDTPVFGFESVTNPADAIEGQSEETDAELRARRTIAATTTGAATVASIYTALLEVTGVVKTSVLQNTGTVTDSDGIPPQHIWAIVSGGSDAGIAETLFEETAAGIGFHNDATGTDVSVAYVDPVTGSTYTIKFNRPDDLDIYYVVDVTTDSNFPGDGADQIKDAIVAYLTDEQDIGEDVEYSRQYTPINSVPGHYVTALKIGTAPAPTGVINVPVDPDEIAVTDTAKITVNVT
jgi:uncharacterized phage protein gp47/JayE